MVVSKAVLKQIRILQHFPDLKVWNEFAARSFTGMTSLASCTSLSRNHLHMFRFVVSPNVAQIVLITSMHIKVHFHVISIICEKSQKEADLSNLYMETQLPAP